MSETANYLGLSDAGLRYSEAKSYTPPPPPDFCCTSLPHNKFRRTRNNFGNKTRICSHAWTGRSSLLCAHTHIHAYNIKKWKPRKSNAVAKIQTAYPPPIQVILSVEEIKNLTVCRNEPCVWYLAGDMA
jgi:hypothetical protein